MEDLILLSLFAHTSAAGCPPLPKPVDGYIEYGRQSSRATFYENGTTAKLMCDRNRLEGPMHTTCVSGYWDPPKLADCEQEVKRGKSCVDIPHGPKSNITYSATNKSGKHPHLSTASKTCVNGGDVLGLSFANCVRGKWVPSPFGPCPSTA